MAASVPSLISTPGLSQKQRKAILKRERRKRKRQALAKQGFKDGENHNSMDEEEADEERQAEEERQQLHAEWLRREMLAQEEFRLRFEREEAARMRKEEDERRIKEEWEAQQRREEEEKEQKQQQRRDREEAVQKMLDQAESQLENGGPWMNPEAPDTHNFGTERDRANCPFFLKTGSCRFGDRCSRRHVYPESSPTLLIRGMFVTFGMDQSRRDDYDTDAGLEDSEEELQQRFLDFYQDVLPEFSSLGKVVQFKVSCNHEPHLRGNVYVQFDTEYECREALVKFNGRWYAGKQLQCELCPVTRWKNAICGLFDRQRCPKGKHCNFLHVYRNPGNQFWEADRDLHLSPNRGGGTHTGGRYSERRGDRGSRRGSRSPSRSERSQGRRQPWERGSERRSRDGGSVRGRRERSRSQSKERRSRRSRGSRERENSMTSGRSSWSRASSRRDRQRSRSRERAGGGERDRERQRDGDRRRAKSGEGDGEGDRDQERRRSREGEGERERDRWTEGDEGRNGEKEGDGERSGGKERRTARAPNGGGEDEGRERRARSGSSSATGLNPSDKKSPDCSTTPRHHKHSKKNKKRKSKKKKKKRSKASESPDRGSTSGEEDEEGEDEGERGSEVKEMNPSASGEVEVVLDELVESSAEGLNREGSTETDKGSPAQQSAGSPDTHSKNAADSAKEEPGPV